MFELGLSFLLEQGTEFALHLHSIYSGCLGSYSEAVKSLSAIRTEVDTILKDLFSLHVHLNRDPRALNSDQILELFVLLKGKKAVDASKLTQWSVDLREQKKTEIQAKLGEYFTLMDNYKNQIQVINNLLKTFLEELDFMQEKIFELYDEELDGEYPLLPILKSPLIFDLCKVYTKPICIRL